MNIYADNAATTKTSDKAIEAMVQTMKNVYGNPSSLYSLGQRAKEVLEQARMDIAKCIGADFKEIYDKYILSFEILVFMPKGIQYSARKIVLVNLTFFIKNI